MTGASDSDAPAGTTIYEERRFSLRVCELKLRDGRVEHRGVVIHPGSVVIIALNPADELVLIRNRRWQIGRRLLELPAGTLESGEDPQACAGRELEEETGYRAGRLEHFHSFFALPGGSTEVMHAYVARDLTPVGQTLMPDEDIEVVCMDVEAVTQALVDGEIVDAKTMALLGLYLLRYPDRP